MMSAEELLGGDNQSRLKELANNSTSVADILKDLASEDTSLWRDAALKILNRNFAAPSPLEENALIDGLTDTLKEPRASEGGDALPWATISEAALAALYSLDAEAEHVDNVLLHIVPYTDADQPWTTESAAFTADRLLDRYLSGKRKQEFIVGSVLQSHLRPLFSKSSSSVTAEGRPALYRAPPPPAGFHAQKATWKEAGPLIVTLFDWAVQASEPTTIKKHWPLYVPVLVTLAEDDDVAVRQRGLQILDVFLAKCPAEVLRTSGIDAVFRESVLPSLLFLPTLTPEAESVVLLRAAYRAVRTLALAADDPADGKRRSLLDRMLREGVLAGYFHASQHIRVVEVLMQAAAQIVEALQIYAVKHLQSLLDLFAPVLTDAFALAYPAAVVAAAQALNTTILNCWPRIVGTPHAEQILNVVSRCWINIHDSDNDRNSSELEMLVKELTKTMTLMASLWKESDEPMPTEKLSQVVRKAPNLKPLFAAFRLDTSTA
ncbi:uncharacterized protein CRV24_005483 [Beauveria bassiana]|nr:uncharacterized protein CRV24_005483 [Beauveria bassiana]KAH8709563.1 Uncharacterized protein HC256_009482 [Beauveria bassiana]KAH8709564.1 Uncharacterized protein HC256_009482 [Beauveria bassiana]